MRKKTKVIIGLALACAGTLVFGACASNESPYRDQAARGYSVQVHYDRNGGIFGSNPNTDLVHVYPLAKVENGVALTEPGSSAFKGLAASASTIDKAGYFLVGWYRERNPLVDGDGNALDEYGELCSVSGKPQGYSYSGYWNFDEKEKLTMDDLTEVTEGKKTTYTFTLYAAWARFQYTFYYENTEGKWEELKDESVDSVSNGSNDAISVPSWDETSGKMIRKDDRFRERAGYTIKDTYLDAEKTIKVDDKIPHPGTYDLQTGLAVNSDTNLRANIIDYPVYTTWREGTWYHITKASQMITSMDASGCYEIVNDLDFTGVGWPFANATFTGKIVGLKEDGTSAKLSNIKITQSNASQLRGGLFGMIAANAEMRDVFFENVTYTLKTATRLTGGEFGLFAGALFIPTPTDSTQENRMKNVRVSGTLEIGAVISDLKFENYTVGLLSGNLVTNDEIVADIELKFLDPSVQGTYDSATGEVILELIDVTSDES